jgi:hypothetical protein
MKRKVWWFKCWPVFGRTILYYPDRAARDAAVAEMVGRGFACTFNN